MTRRAWIRTTALAGGLAATIAAASCRSSVTPSPGAARARGATSKATWVERTLAGMSLEQKAAQLVFLRLDATTANPEEPGYRDVVDQVRALEPGGVVLFRTPRDTLPIVVDELQSASRVPLLLALDVERSVAFRVPDGTTPMPYDMAIGAIPGDAGLAAARFAGELTARESRALGIRWALAPVADVNNNPENPVINVRSFGEDPRRVADLVSAWIEGARGEGVLTTAKHFPGHGDTDIDSHLDLPRIPGDRTRIETVELMPFRAAVSAGVDSVMAGHLVVPALDPSGASAIVSRPMLTGVLRGELGFDGLIATDALDMKGAGTGWLGRAAVRAVGAGADVLLIPRDPRVTVQSLARAVREGQLEAARLDEAARRVLTAKARIGLERFTAVDPLVARREVGRPEDQERAAEITAQSITVVRNRGGVLPLHAEEPLRILHLALSSDAASAGTVPEEELAKRDVEVTSRRFGVDLTDAEADAVVALAPRFSHVLVSAYVTVTSGKGQIDMAPSHARLIERLAATGVPVILVSYGSPYLLAQVPDVPVYVCTYGRFGDSEPAAMAALFGEHAVGGRLPVSIPGLAAVGDGVDLPRREKRLEPSTPEAAGFRPGALDEVARVLDDFRARHAFPGGVVAVGHRGKLAYLHPFGSLTYDADSPPVTADTLYDLASLTKVVVTTTLTMIMVDEGRLDLDQPVQTYLPRFVGAGKDKVTVRQLITHSSGIDWWAPLYQEIHGWSEYVERIEAMDLVYEPGTETRYSDLGIILLGEILQRVSGEPFEELARRRIFEPLGLTETMYRPPAALLDRIAPTENDPWRGRVVGGEVHDENAFAMGGVAPHAGLFSSAPDLARFVQMLLWKGFYDGERLVDRETVEMFTRRANVVVGSDRALGWDTKSATGSSAGTLFSADSFGHTGFTGTSIWVDPARGLFVILLTNRVHPSRDDQLIREARPAVADAVIRALAEPALVPRDTAHAVATGLDRVARGDVPELAGKRIGLVVHAASVSADGRSAVQVFRDRGLDVVRLFSPEHGLAGAAAPGEKVASAVDPASGLPVVSLYGSHTRPTPEELAGLDALVFDLQGAGVRFYTYSSTLLDCLEAAAESGLPFYVLDRPNPLGGVRVEGPVSAPRDVVPASFVNRAPGTLVHGLTLGEMATWANQQGDRKARLTVIEMEGWDRRMTWRDTGRVWVDPSPNLRSPEAALAYPGVALLEATNVSEGRGTSTPFLLVGAPWLDPARIQVDVPGFRLAPTTFTPHAEPVTPNPKYDGVPCRGFQIEVTDAHIADPYRLGVTLLHELMRQQGFEWRLGGDALVRLTGTRELLESLLSGASVDQILAGEEEACRHWVVQRRAASIYPYSPPDSPRLDPPPEQR